MIEANANHDHPFHVIITHKKRVIAGRKSFGRAFGAAAPSPWLLTRFLTRQSEVVARTSAPASTCSCLLRAEPSIPTSAPHSSAGSAPQLQTKVKLLLTPAAPHDSALLGIRFQNVKVHPLAFEALSWESVESGGQATDSQSYSAKRCCLNRSDLMAVAACASHEERTQRSLGVSQCHLARLSNFRAGFAMLRTQLPKLFWGHMLLQVQGAQCMEAAHLWDLVLKHACLVASRFETCYERQAAPGVRRINSYNCDGDYLGQSKLFRNLLAILSGAVLFLKFPSCGDPFTCLFGT